MYKKGANLTFSDSFDCLVKLETRSVASFGKLLIAQCSVLAKRRIVQLYLIMENK